MAETLIGMDESGGSDKNKDAVAQFAVLQKKMQIVNEHAEKLLQLEQRRREQAKSGSDKAVTSAMALSAEHASIDCLRRSARGRQGNGCRLRAETCGRCHGQRNEEDAKHASNPGG